MSELDEAIAGDWLHLNTAPRDGEFLAHSRTWKRPRFVRRVTGGEFISVDGRKVIPQVWYPLPRLKK
jgi:hypothetical protein